MSKPNIVHIVIDSLRADHLGCYGYAKNTSPYIDALAREGVVFDRAFAVGIPTMPSFTTTLSGLHPYRHGITAHASEQRLPRDVVLLPQLAREAGYTTIGIDNLAVQSNGRGSWFTRGFDYYSGFLYKPFSDQTAQLIDRAQSYIADEANAPFYLFLHLWDPHSPYSPPEPFDKLHYNPEPAPDDPTLEEAMSHAPDYYESFLEDMKLKVKGDYGYVVAQYDGEISYVDQQVGRLIDFLKESGLYEDTMFVLQSDHGECFGEGGIYFDHHGLYDAVIRVPLIIKAPGRQAGRCDAMVATDDITPTLAALGGMELPAYPLTGTSFAGAIDGKEIIGRSELFCVESTRQASLCLRTEKWKLIQPIVRDSNGEEIYNIYGESRAEKPVLFDLKNDPRELHDVSEQYPQIRDELLERLNLWRSEQVERRGADPLLEGLSLPYSDFMSRLNARSLRAG